MSKFSIATWNVNGIRAREQQFSEWVKRDRPDIICLQEIKASPEKVPEPLSKLAGYHCYWHGTGGYSGVALHVRQDAFAVAPTYSHPSFDFETRIVEADLGEFVVASVYVPNGGKDFAAKMRFLEALVAHAKALSQAGKKLILCGDLNVAHTERDVNEKDRKPEVIGQRPEERALFDQLLSENLTDVQRMLYPDRTDLFTWWAPWRNLRQRNIGWRIDYILASQSLAARIKTCPVLVDVGSSDHAPVVAVVE